MTPLITSECRKFKRRATNYVRKAEIERDFDRKVVERTVQAVIIAPIGFQLSNENALVYGYDA